MVKLWVKSINSKLTKQLTPLKTIRLPFWVYHLFFWVYRVALLQGKSANHMQITILCTSNKIYKSFGSPYLIPFQPLRCGPDNAWLFQCKVVPSEILTNHRNKTKLEACWCCCCCCCWLLVVGCWLLVVRCLLFAVGIPLSPRCRFCQQQAI